MSYRPTGRSRAGRERAHSTASTADHLVPDPNTHLVTSKWSSSLYLSHIPLSIKKMFKKKKKKKNLPPHSEHPPPPNTNGGKQGARHALGSGKKPGTEKEAGLVLSFLVRFPAASAAAIHRRCRRIPPPRHDASLLPAHIDRGSGRVRGGTDGKE